MTTRDASPKRPKNTFTIVIIPGPKVEYIVKKIKKADLTDVITKTVGGHFQMMPKNKTSELEAYVNEEGLLRNLPNNYVAGDMLFQLGFATNTLPIKHVVSGPVVLTRMLEDGEDATLRKKDLELIEKVFQAMKDDQ